MTRSRCRSPIWCGPHTAKSRRIWRSSVLITVIIVRSHRSALPPLPATRNRSVPSQRTSCSRWSTGSRSNPPFFPGQWWNARACSRAKPDFFLIVCGAGTFSFQTMLLSQNTRMLLQKSSMISIYGHSFLYRQFFNLVLIQAALRPFRFEGRWLFGTTLPSRWTYHFLFCMAFLQQLTLFFSDSWYCQKNRSAVNFNRKLYVQFLIICF